VINNCPFCKSGVINAGTALIDGDDYRVHYVHCIMCDSKSSNCETEQEAIEAWNKPGDRIRELEDAVTKLMDAYK